ncbi:unnamed protein product [Calypogeia fissa]
MVMSSAVRSFGNSSVLVVFCILINRAVAVDLSSLVEDGVVPEHNLCSRSDPAMDPFYEVRYGQDVVWQIPSNPKAVLFMAHGMDKDPLGYFDPGPNCRQCYGLPENRGAVLAALERNYAVILVKSVDRYWLPWGVEVWPPPPSEDRFNVISIIKEWTKEHFLDHLPLAAFGYSSGGNFSTLLSFDLSFKSLILMCTPGEVLALVHANASFPPTLFLDMPADTTYSSMAAYGRKLLETKGVRTGMIDIFPRPISPLNFTEKIPCLQRETAELIYGAYKAESWLDDDDYVIMNPIMVDPEAVLWKHNVLPFCQSENDLCLAQHVLQEIGVAYAFHSFSSQFNQQIFDWLDYTVFHGSSEPAGLWRS